MNKYIFILIVTIISCNQTEYKQSNEYKIQAQVWTQNSAEYRALCYQVNTARLNLDSFLSSDKKFNKPLAIITDVDETVLDNSPYAENLF